MTKKRHTKLMRALTTCIHNWAVEHGEITPKNDMYKGVRLANDGFIPTGYATRASWWESVAKSGVLEIFGMSAPKEVR